jgi:hypothetical protein
MTSHDDTLPVRKVRVQPSFDATAGMDYWDRRDYWRTHVEVLGPEDDDCFAEAADSLDVWITDGCKHLAC